MKRLLLILSILSFCQFSRGQETFSFGLKNSSFTSSGGTTLGISTYNYVKEGLVVSICHFGDKSTYIEISEAQLPLFFQQLRQIEKKYGEWLDIAGDNNVETIVKKIPIDIPYRSMYQVPIMSSTTSSSFEPFFYLKNGKVALQFKIRMECYQTRAEDEWWFWIGDVEEFIKTISDTFDRDKEQYNKQNEINQLFK